MKITLKCPIVKKTSAGSWEKYQVDGSVEVELGELDYSSLKEQINNLLAETTAEYQLVADSREIEEQIPRPIDYEE